jgi:diacylglycerol O-acyltransferase / wax synthase
MEGSREPERLSAADASNIVIDAQDQVNAFLLAGILGVGGFVSEAGETDLDRLRAAITDRIGGSTVGALRRLAQRVHVEGRILSWESCDPDLTWHVREVEPVAGAAGLADLAATMMTVPLPQDRPRWELLVVPGAGPAGPGIILRLHHSVADGVAGVRLVQQLFGDAPSPSLPPTPPITRPPHATTSPASPGSAPPRPTRRWRSLATSVSRVSAVFRATVPPTVLLGPIGPRRGVAFAEVDLGSLGRAAKAAGATVNDALLAAVAVAVEATLRAGGQPVPPVLPASVPVALPGRGTSGNAVGVMAVPLPTGEPDTAARLALIAASTRSAKAAARAQGTFELTRTRWGSRLFFWLARRQRFIALFVTNVRGPDEPLHLAGAPLERAWPVAPIQGNVRLGVAAMSYAGRLGVAVHTDADAVSARSAGRALNEELTRIAAPP